MVWNKIAKQVFKAGLHPVIITTNYDLVCESQLNVPSSIGPGDRNDAVPWYYRVFVQANRWFAPRRDRHAQSVPFSGPGVDKRVPIIKLHGSVNWLRLEGTWLSDERVENSSLGTPQGDVLDRLATRFWRHNPTARPDELHYEPGIIPPMLGKARIEELFTQQWAAAIDAIHRSSQIWVIGYSFPRTDTFMSRLLAEGLGAKHDFRRLNVVDLAPSVEEHGINDLLADQMRKNKFRYYPADARHVFDVMADQAFETWEDKCGRIRQR